MNQDKLYSFSVEDWKLLEGQFRDLYRPTYAFVLENKGSMAEAHDVYVDAFLYYLQLIEFKGFKLTERAEVLIYSFSRKLWLLKLEKRRVDLDFVKHRREYFEMEEAFHQIDSINQRSLKTSEKLAQIGEPCRTLMLECVGRRKDIDEVAPRLGFTDETRALANLAQCTHKLIKLTEGKEFEIGTERFQIIMRYALDGMEQASQAFNDDEKLCLTMVSRVVAMVRNHVNRGERMDRFREMQEKSLPHSLAGIDEMSEEGTPKKKLMKSIATIGVVIAAAIGVSALTAFGVSEALHSKHENELAAIEAAADTLITEEAVPVDLPPTNVSAFAIADEGYLVTAAAPLRHAKRVTIQSNTWEGELAAKILHIDTLQGIALLRVDTLPQHVGRLPYRLSPEPGRLGDHLYSLAYNEGALQYSDGSLSAILNNGKAQVYMPSASPGAPVIGIKGQVEGMLLNGNPEGALLHNFVSAASMASWLRNLNDSSDFGFKLSARNGLYYSEKPRQLEQLQPFIYGLKIYH